MRRHSAFFRARGRGRLAGAADAADAASPSGAVEEASVFAGFSAFARAVPAFFRGGRRVRAGLATSASGSGDSTSAPTGTAAAPAKRPRARTRKKAE